MLFYFHYTPNIENVNKQRGKIGVKLASEKKAGLETQARKLRKCVEFAPLLAPQEGLEPPTY